MPLIVSQDYGLLLLLLLPLLSLSKYLIGTFFLYTLICTNFICQMQYFG